MNGTTLTIGMPAGSLADPKRGGSLVTLLKNAGFHTKGYDQGGPTEFPLTSFLVGWDGRPQEFGAQLALGDLDIAIAGDDWIRERQLEMKHEYGTSVELVRAMALNRGDVRIVIIKRESEEECDAWLQRLLAEKPLITMVSEMPYLAIEWFHRKARALGYEQSHSAYSVQNYRTPPKIEQGLVIYETWGKTEAKVKNRAVDFGMEITQSGSAIRNYGLSIADVVMHSETAIWANPNVRSDPKKLELARSFLLNLYGAVYAEDKVLLAFNCKKAEVEAIRSYLEENRLFANEPTMTEGINYTEFSIQLDVKSARLPLAQVRYELATRGATGIETIPLESSIPGLDVLTF